MRGIGELSESTFFSLINAQLEQQKIARIVGHKRPRPNFVERMHRVLQSKAMAS